MNRALGLLIDVRDNLYVKYIWPDRAFPGRYLRRLFEKLAPRPIAAIAAKLRHLQPAPNRGARLLDVGCGDGAFFPRAQRLGYRPTGIDPDPVAVARAVAKSRDVSVGSLEANDLPSASFDHVMLAHVLEHFHDTAAALDEVYRLLRPGGRLWIVQPSLGALGLIEFGPHWRGLEVPRHMVLMTPARLMTLLHARGFVGAELQKLAYEGAYYFKQSLAILNEEDPNHGPHTHWSQVWAAKARKADAIAFADPSVAESMTVTAFKP